MSFLSSLTPYAYAQYDGIVQCSGLDCNFCTAVSTINELISFLVTILILIGVLLIIYAGFKLVVSTGNPSAMQDAKGMLTNVIIGFVIVLAAWTIVDTIMKALVSSDAGFGVWNEISGADCGGMTEARNPGGYDLSAEEFELDLATGDPDLAGISLVDSISDTNLFETAGVFVPPSPSGQLCYPSMNCFPALPGSEINNIHPDFNYAAVSMTGPSQYIDLSVANLSTPVSDNFTLGEVTQTSCRKQYAYISPEAVAGVQQVRNMIGTGFSLNSGYRSPSCNAQVKGATQSKHMLGIGFDIQPPAGVSRQTIVDACKAAGSGFQQIYDDHSHVHCDWR